jgi:hypothetical protein
MHHEPPEGARTVWQGQPADSPDITLERLRERARELRIKTRKESLGNSALALITIGVSIHGLIHTRDRGWHIELGFLATWALAGWYISHQGSWPERLPARFALRDGLSFYRRELKRRRDLFRRFFGWSFIPACLALISWILIMSGLARHLHLSVNFVPLCTLLGLWIAGILVLRFRTGSELKRELDELAALEREGESLG